MVDVLAGPERFVKSNGGLVPGVRLDEHDVSAPFLGEHAEAANEAGGDASIGLAARGPVALSFTRCRQSVASLHLGAF